jgi:hypothetical protein
MSRTTITGLMFVAIVGIATWFVTGHRADDAKPVTPVAEASPPSIATPAIHPEATPPAGPAAQTTSSGVFIRTADVDAIARLDTRSLIVCNRELLVKKGIEQFSCAGIGENDTLAQNHCRSQLAAVDRRLQEFAAKAAPCPESLAQPSLYFGAIRDRANSGDVNAQRCFIQGYFGISRELKMDLTQAEHDEYVPLAKKFIDSRLEQGDWSVVRWLAKSKVDAGDFLLASAYPIGIEHPDTVYKLNRLLLYGNKSAGETITKNDDPKRVVDFLRQEKRLTAEQLEEAEGWAKTMYDQHFNGSQEGADIGADHFCDKR